MRAHFKSFGELKKRKIEMILVLVFNRKKKKAIE
jgi:hypothetical protein